MIRIASSLREKGNIVSDTLLTVQIITKDSQFVSLSPVK